MERVRGAVLAGGDSTRFEGGDKALAELAGRPLVDRVVAAVDAAIDGHPILAVVTDEEADRLQAAVEPSVETVRDGPDHAGPLAGLFAAAAAAGVDAGASDGWLFACACDMPLVSPASIDALASAAATTSGGDRPAAVVTVVDGYDEPLHALYRPAAVTAVEGEVPDGAGLMALLDALDSLEGFDGVVRVEATDLGRPVLDAVSNVNTRADLAAVRERLEER